MMTNRVLVSFLLMGMLLSVGCKEDDSPVDSGDEWHGVLKQEEGLNGFWRNLDDDSRYSFCMNECGTYVDESGSSQMTWYCVAYVPGGPDSLYLNFGTDSTAFEYMINIGSLELSSSSGTVVYEKMQSDITLYEQEGPHFVAFSLPEAADIDLYLEDAAGERRATLAEGEFQIGIHEISFDVEPLFEMEDVLVVFEVEAQELRATQLMHVGIRPALSASAKDYLDDHYTRELYHQAEYALMEGSYEGSYEDWMAETEFDRRHLLLEVVQSELPPPGGRNGPFGFVVPITQTDGWYWMVGAYPEQFGFGWDDTVDDDLETVIWDGTSDHLVEYQNMLGL